MDRQQIMEVVARHIRTNAQGLDDAPIDGAKSMKDFGLSSLDIVEVVSASMRELRIRVPRTELASLSNIDELVDLFQRAKQAQ